MRRWVRWSVGIGIVGLGLLLAVFPLFDALEAASELGGTTDAATRRNLQLAVAGGWLTAAGWLGNSVAGAMTFPTLWRQLGESSRVPGGRRGLRRVNRQIDGKEPYRGDEIACLRWHAERRVVASHSWRTTFMQLISLIALVGGLALTPPRPVPTSDDDLPAVAFLADGANLLGPVLRMFAAVTVLAFVAMLVAVWRMRGDPKARAFLERTRPVSWPTDGPHP